MQATGVAPQQRRCGVQSQSSFNKPGWVYFRVTSKMIPVVDDVSDSLSTFTKNIGQDMMWRCVRHKRARHITQTRCPGPRLLVEIIRTGPMTAIQARPQVDRPAAVEPLLSAAANTTASLSDAYRDHHGAVYNVARRVCGPSGAEDVVQEVFLRLWRDPHRFDPSRGSLRTFLLAMTHTMAIDRVRASTARHRREERSARLGDSVPADVETDALAHEAREQVVAAVETLPHREKEAILTAFYGRGTYRDAARILGQPEGTVKGRIRAGLKRLEVALADPSDSGLI